MTNVEVVIEDDGTECTSYYQVWYKLNTDSSFTQIANQFASPIVFANMPDGMEFTGRVIRHCCNGQYSNPIEFPFTTADDGLPAPANFTASTIYTNEIELTWDEVIGATNYIIDRAEDAGFTVGVTEVYNSSYGTGYYLNAPVTGVYYYRIKAQASGYDDSPYATATGEGL